MLQQCLQLIAINHFIWVNAAYKSEALKIEIKKSKFFCKSSKNRHSREKGLPRSVVGKFIPIQWNEQAQKIWPMKPTSKSREDKNSRLSKTNDLGCIWFCDVGGVRPWSVAEKKKVCRSLSALRELRAIIGWEATPSNKRWEKNKRKHIGTGN